LLLLDDEMGKGFEFDVDCGDDGGHFEEADENEDDRICPPPEVDPKGLFGLKGCFCECVELLHSGFA